MNALKLKAKYTKALGKLFPDMVMPNTWKQIEISHLAQDSREAVSGSVFFALDGAQSHGENYLENAAVNGASVIFVERNKETQAIQNLKQKYPEIPVFIDDNLSKSVSKIAGTFFDDPSQGMMLVGVTGTNGKSSCVHLISELWKHQGKRAAQIGTLGFGLNSNDGQINGIDGQSKSEINASKKTKTLGPLLTSTGLTTPSAIQTQEILAELKDEHASHVAMEVSSHGIHQSRVAGLQFDVAILTNITRDHLDYHKTFEEYVRVKSSFVSDFGAKISIVNLDDLAGRELSLAWRSRSSLLTYSLNDSSADLHIVQKDFHINGVTARICSPWGTGVLRTSLLGEFNLSNLLASIAACCACGDSFQKVLRSISKITAPDGRMQKVMCSSASNVVSLDLQRKVYIDFAHTPDALEKAITALRKHCEKNIWLVFGCGGDRDAGKRVIMGKIAAKYADYLVITSDNPRTENPAKILEQIACGVKAGLGDKRQVRAQNLVEAHTDVEPLNLIESREQAIRFAIEHAKNTDVVLIAGKGHENYQIIGDKSYPFSDYSIALKSLEMCSLQDGGSNK